MATFFMVQELRLIVDAFDDKRKISAAKLGRESEILLLMG